MKSNTINVLQKYNEELVIEVSSLVGTNKSWIS